MNGIEELVTSGRGRMSRVVQGAAGERPLFSLLRRRPKEHQFAEKSTQFFQKCGRGDNKQTPKLSRQTGAEERGGQILDGEGKKWEAGNWSWGPADFGDDLGGLFFLLRLLGGGRGGSGSEFFSPDSLLYRAPDSGFCAQ